MDIFSEQDLNMLMSYLDPAKFSSSLAKIKADEGLLNSHLEDEIKYEICKLLHSFCDYVLRFRVEAIVSFSSEYVRQVQTDQKKRYSDLKESSLPSAIMAKKTKEFRCPARDQMQALVNFKASESSQLDLSDDIKTKLIEFHANLNKICQIKERAEEESGDADTGNSKGFVTRVVKLLFSSEYSDNSETTELINSAKLEPQQHNIVAICDELSKNDRSHSNFHLLTYRIKFNVKRWLTNTLCKKLHVYI